MADKITVKAEKRDSGGKNVNRRLRASGKIPVIVYGGGGESVSVTAELKEIAAVLRSDSGVNTVFSLDLAGEGTGDVIFQDRQIDPVKGRLIHADLRRIAKGEKIEMTIPIHLTGEAEGLKEDGAVLSQAVREVKVLVEPAKAPEAFNVDISELAVGHSLHISDLKVGEGIEIHEAPETVIASVVIVREADLEPQISEGAEPEIAGDEGKSDEDGGE